MFRYVFYILVIQICYCSACQCSCGVAIPTPAICVIGIINSLMLFTIIVLSVMVYRYKRGQDSKNSIFGSKHVSINNYKRQMSGNSDHSFIRNSTTECPQLENENRTCGSHLTKNITDAKEENILQKVLKQPQAPILGMAQMREICEGVLLKSRMKESTSLSDLDKIVNDAKMEHDENTKKPDISASTPELDVYDMLPTPLLVKKERLEECSSNLFQNEMHETFNNTDKIKTISNELTLKFNQANANIAAVPDEMHEIEFQQDSNVMQHNIKGEIMLNSNDKEVMAKLCQSGKTKALRSDLQEKIKQVTDSNMNPTKIQLMLGQPYDSTDEASVKEDEVYDNPPSKPRRIVLQDDIYDSPPSRFSAQDKIENEMYDSPPSRSLLDHGKVGDELYEFPKSKSRKIIVNDDDATGYIYPISDDDNLAFLTEPHYSNANTVMDFDII